MRYKPFNTQGDIAKLQAEIHQLRNQQFTLGTLAITAFGLAAWLLPQPKQGESYNPLLAAVASLGLLVLFWLMLRWTRTLWTVIAVIARYLELRGASEWERDFRDFTACNECISNLSQSRAVALVYMWLGILVPVLYLCVALPAESEQHVILHCLVGAAAFIYLANAFMHTFCEPTEDNITKGWEKVLRNRCLPVDSIDVTSPK